MPKKFDTLELEAKNQWHELVNGSDPWIRVGTAICGIASGASEIIRALQKELKDRNLSARISEVGCFGLCYAEPLVDVLLPGGARVFYGNVTPEKVAKIIEAHIVNRTPEPGLALGFLGNTDVEGIPSLNELPMMKPQTRIVLRNAGSIDPADIYQYIAAGGYRGLNKALSEMDPGQICEEISRSGLRGRGGAAFPTGTKWNFLARSSASTKYILCNAEEGDPGAFNDKGILESDPFLLLEGMTLAGYATGATHGYILIRHGHDGPIDRSWNAIDIARSTGLLGKNILDSGFDFDIEVALCGDSYISGEETALMETIEGKRAMPRFRPPFPAQVGLFNQPTNINNVKTLAYVPDIIARGAEWFSGIGTEKSKGTAILCLSGTLNYRGMAEVPFGLTLREVVEELAGGTPNQRKLRLLQTGGPLGGVLSADRLDIPMDFESMQQAGAILGSGGIIAADEDTCVVDLTRNLVAFCQFESCGKCFPCKLGMTHILETLERICHLQGHPNDLELLQRVGKNMQAGSLCGHGQLGFNPVSSALRYFPEEFDDHIVQHHCETGRCREPSVFPERTRR